MKHLIKFTDTLKASSKLEALKKLYLTDETLLIRLSTYLTIN